MLNQATRALRLESFDRNTQLRAATKLARDFNVFNGCKPDAANLQLLCRTLNTPGWNATPYGWLSLLLAYGALRRNLFSADQAKLVEAVVTAQLPTEAAVRRLILKLMPKAELHVHLDGSMTPEFIFEQALSQGVDLRTAVPGLEAMVPATTELTLEHVRTYQGSPQDKVSDFPHFLSLFNLALAVLQTRDGLKAAALDLMRQGHEEHVTHMEIRFAPMLHQTQRLNYNDICDALLEGINEGQKKYGMTSALIMAAYRDKIETAGFEHHDILTAACAVDMAEKNLYDIPIGFDLVGFESPDFPLNRFEPAFGIAGTSPTLWKTVHAGETHGLASHNNMITAAELGYIQRIGHGIHALDLPSNLEPRLAARLKMMTLEISPTSNVQLGCSTSHETHPLLQLTEAGYLVTVNTDNRQISGIALTDEFVVLTERMGIPLLEDKNGAPQLSQPLKRIAAQAYRAAFRSDAHRNETQWLQYHRDWVGILDTTVALIFGKSSR